jgi:uncharacterized membrane protein YkvA (DUF1232 family)
MNRAEKMAKKFESEASEGDIQKIDNKLEHMNKGKVSEVWEKIEALYKMIKDPNADWKAKAVAVGALIYLISPVDAVPDIIPVVGLSDDVAVILTAISVLSLQLKEYISENQRENAELQKGIIIETDEKRVSLEKDLQREIQHTKQKFILKIVLLGGSFATAITLILKLL